MGTVVRWIVAQDEPNRRSTQMQLTCHSD